MPSNVKRLTEKQLIRPPAFLPANVHYETIMGSFAYGVSSDTSDMDIYGFCIPEKQVIFPHLAGEIMGFGRQHQRFEQWQQHHVSVPDDLGGRGRVYDFQIFSIVKYFNLAMENNPNMVDSLFTSRECLLHTTPIGEMVRESRKLFLHRGAWHKFKGYAYSQLHKMSSKSPIGKRVELREKFGFDVKFAYHVVRLLDEVEQILTLGDIDLHRAKEHMKAIRRGDVSEEDIRKWAADKELALEKAYAESKLPYGPDEDKIKKLLLNCLEHHFGSLADCIVSDFSLELMDELQEVLEHYRRRRAKLEQVTKQISLVTVE